MHSRWPASGAPGRRSAQAVKVPAFIRPHSSGAARNLRGAGALDDFPHGVGPMGFADNPSTVTAGKSGHLSSAVGLLQVQPSMRVFQLGGMNARHARKSHSVARAGRGVAFAVCGGVDRPSGKHTSTRGRSSCSIRAATARSQPQPCGMATRAGSPRAMGSGALGSGCCHRRYSWRTCCSSRHHLHSWHS